MSKLPIVTCGMQREMRLRQSGPGAVAAVEARRAFDRWTGTSRKRSGFRDSVAVRG